MNKVIAITGPAGAGKSAVAIRLARLTKKSTHIDADNVKHMIESGFTKEIKPNGEKIWHYSEWELVGEGIGLLAKLFLDSNHRVIINGYIDEKSWELIEKHIPIDHKLLLLPDLKTVIHRDTLRDEGYQMGKAMVTEHHEHFSNSPFYKDFIKIDTSHQTVDETVAIIKEKYFS